MSTKAFKEYLAAQPHPDLYFDLVNLVAMIDAGLAGFIIAPPSGGKSTLMIALEIIYKDPKANYFVFTMERVSPMRFLRLQEAMKDRKNLLMSDDFSTFADSEDSIYKMANIMTQLSYKHQYNDPFYATKDNEEGLKIVVQQLSFICGMQPQWLQAYAGTETFETLIMEKLLRYYRLPIDSLQGGVDAIDPNPEVLARTLAEAVQAIKPQSYKIAEETISNFAKDIRVQCGARAIQYSRKLLPTLAKYIPEDIFIEWLKQTANRFSFEENLLLRGFEPFQKKMQHEALFREYLVLFFALQFSPLTYMQLKDLAKIRGKNKAATKRYMQLMIKYALEAGYINVVQRDGRVNILPAEKYQDLSIHNFNQSFLCKDRALKKKEN